jgi:2-keto-4-pentenoate hydratase
MAALEIGHLRTGVEKRSLPTFLGLNTLNGGLVLGGRIVNPAAAGLDLRLEGMALEIDGRPAGSGTGAEALGDPRGVVAWLANLLARYGRRLEPGQIVITGSIVQGPIMKPGQTVRARFTHLGDVSCRFEE